MANDKQEIEIDWYKVKKVAANCWLSLVGLAVIGLFLAGLISLLCDPDTRPFALVMGGFAAFMFITMWAAHNS